MLTHQSEYELDNTIFSNLNTISLKTDLNLKSFVEIKLPLTGILPLTYYIFIKY